MALVVYRFFYVYTKHITIARSDSWWSWEISAPKNAWANTCYQLPGGMAVIWH